MTSQNNDFSKIEDFSENAHRVRRNLLIFSCVSLILYFSGNLAKITQLNILGAELTNIPQLIIPITLFIITFYHWCHFLWFVVEHCRYNHLALSRIVKKGSYTAWGGVDLNQDNWNLYLWWNQNFNELTKKFDHLQNMVTQNLEYYDEIFERIEKERFKGIEKERPVKLTRANYLGRSSSDLDITISINFKNIKRDLDTLTQIEKPLERFNKAFKSYSKISVRRWLIIEYGLPIIIGFFSYILIIIEISRSICEQN